MTDLIENTRMLARAGSPAEMLRAAVALSKPGATSKAAAQPEFRDGLERLLTWVREGRGADRLLALAVIARLRKQQNKPFAESFERALLQPVAPFETPPGDLDDPKDRDYLAQGLLLVRFENQDLYLADFVAGEGQTKTDARDAAALALVVLSPSLTGVFRYLADALRRQKHDTQDPATSRVRRLTRVLEALHSALRMTDPAVGPETGSAYAALVQAGLDSNAERPASIDVVGIALALLLAWVRPNFSVTREPETFAAVYELRKLFLPARWPDETRDSLRSVGGLVRESMSMLAEAGVADDRLRATLIAIVDEPVAAGMLKTLAREKPGIPNDVRHWLETGRAMKPAQGGEALGETVLATVDRDIAEAFREGTTLSRDLASVHEDLTDGLRLSAPSMAHAFEDIVSRIQRLSRRLEALGSKRGFSLEGEVGASVEYSPTDHVSDHPIAGTRFVRIVSPMVVRRHEGGAPQLVVKAKVEGA